MRTRYFTHWDIGYQCSETGDCEGEYLRAEDVRELVEAANEIIRQRLHSYDYIRLESALKKLEAAEQMGHSAGSTWKSQGWNGTPERSTPLCLL